MKIFAILVSCLVCCSVLAQNVVEYPGSYIILAPKIVRPGLTFTLSVNVRTASGTVTVSATIKEKDSKSHVAQAETTLSAGDLATIDLEVPDSLTFPVGQYQLEVSGTGGLNFSDSQYLQFDVAHFAIFIQTDKAIYKPGQTVHFRIFGVNPGMLPYTGPFNVSITDPDDNIIQLWTDLQNETYGVITQSMLMSSEPVLGDWTIKASAEGQDKTKEVTIEEYVLPKFEVNVVLPPYITEEDSQLNIQIDAKYTYGKPLKGEADLIIRFNYHPGIITRSVQLDGTADVSVSRKDIKQLYLSYNTWTDTINEGTLIYVSASITEDLTGLTQNASATVSYYSKPIKVEALPISSMVFKPGLTFTTYLVVTHQDGSMLTESERRHSLLVAFNDGSDWIRSAYSIPESGVVEATLDVDERATSLQVKALYYRQSSQELNDWQPDSYQSYLTKMYSPSDAYIQIALDTEQVTIGEDVTLRVKTTEIPSELTYMVIAQGNIVLVDSLNALTADVNTITITIDSTMAPKARVIVSFIKEGGEVVVDSVELQVNGIFKNQVSVSFDRDTSEPGDDITFNIEASANSFVGILAVDQSVLILKSGNDITRQEVIDGLSDIDTNPAGSDTGYPVSMWYPRYSVGSSAREIYNDAGLLVISDAQVPGFISDYSYYSSYAYAYRAYADGGREWSDDADARPVLMQDSSNNVNSDNNPIQVTVRKQFPETWLWSDCISDSNGQVTVKTAVPDTITSWLGSAFAISLVDGVGVAEAPAKTTVFKPFFVSLNLPYSIIRGEILILQATVFNYFDTEVKATVTLGKSPHYNVITVDENGIEKSSSESIVDKVTIPTGNGVSVFFPINITKIGSINLEVKAICDRAGDAVRRRLLVEPEGISHSVSESRLINEKTDMDIEEVFSIGLPSPEKLVSGSVRVLLSVTGDIMGPTMNNLDSLLKMPNGCGEQNMINFAPDVFVYEYLTVTEQNNAAIKDKAYRFMLSGYQRELTYKHTDGSFSAFGKNDPSGSIWLTSFVARSFTGAAKFITIDMNVIEKAVTFMIDLQKRSGKFREPGRIVDSGIEGGISPGATLTAYITIALQEVLNSPLVSESIKADISNSISRAQGYLENQLDTIRGDTYALSLVTYALAITKSSSVSTFRQALDNAAITEGGQRHWSAGDEDTSDEEDYWYKPYHGPSSNDVEMTAYALLTYLEMDDIPGASSIAKWMTHQRNAFGGYGSTQDTVVGLQALTAFALVFRDTDPQVDLSVSISSDPSYTHEISVNTDNAIVLQQVELPTQTGKITISGRGRGTCLMTVAIFYNVKAVHERQSFEYMISIEDVDDDNLVIQACGRYLGEAEVTSMCLMDIGIPSGFTADHDRLADLIGHHPLVQKFETVQQSVYLYFQEIPKDEKTCVTLYASRSNVVANIQPKYARLYDYYNPAEQVMVEYTSDALQGHTICEICPDCAGCTGGAKEHTICDICPNCAECTGGGKEHTICEICPDCAGCTGGAKQPYVSLLLFTVTLLIAVFINNV